MEVLWVFLTAGAVLAAGLMYWKTSRILKGMDRMLESALDGTFSETEYTEDLLSRLESRMCQYLSMDRQERQKTAGERDRIKTLVSDISHQTKTPVANILLYIQLLLEHPGLDDEAGRIAGQIETQTKKLDFLLRSLLWVSRLENGIVAVVPRKSSIRELMEGLLCPAEAGEKGVKFYIEGEVPDICAYFDPKWTMEALSNVVDNGIKYTPAGGTVSVSVQAYEMFIRIDVKDTGIGISEADTSRIFTRFYRSPKVQEEKGVGLGLYLTREILQREGGYIKVASVPGEGSVFSLFLPK